MVKSPKFPVPQCWHWILCGRSGTPPSPSPPNGPIFIILQKSSPFLRDCGLKGASGRHLCWYWEAGEEPPLFSGSIYRLALGWMSKHSSFPRKPLRVTCLLLKLQAILRALQRFFWLLVASSWASKVTDFTAVVWDHWWLLSRFYSLCPSKPFKPFWFFFIPGIHRVVSDFLITPWHGILIS